MLAEIDAALFAQFEGGLVELGFAGFHEAEGAAEAGGGDGDIFLWFEFGEDLPDFFWQIGFGGGGLLGFSFNEVGLLDAGFFEFNGDEGLDVGPIGLGSGGGDENFGSAGEGGVFDEFFFGEEMVDSGG